MIFPQTIQMLARPLPILGMLLVSVQAWCDEATLERFRREAPAAWKQTRSLYTRSAFDYTRHESDRIEKDGDVVVTSTQITGTFNLASVGLVSERSLDYSMTDAPEVFDRLPEDSPVRAQAEALMNGTTSGIRLRNPEYIASISSRENPSINGLQRTDDTPAPEMAKKVRRLDYASMPGLRLGGFEGAVLDRSIVGFETFVQAKGYGNYMVKDATLISSGKHQGMVRIDLVLGALENGVVVRESVGVYAGHAILDPQRAWSVVEYWSDHFDKNGNYDSKTTVTLTYRNDGLPHPESASYLDKPTSADVVEIGSEETFSKLRPSSITDRDCYLSAYGLSEPEGTVPASWFWMFVSSVGAPLLAFLIYILWKRRGNRHALA